jgi:hypothetical protein
MLLQFDKILDEIEKRYFLAKDFSLPRVSKITGASPTSTIKSAASEPSSKEPREAWP